MNKEREQFVIDYVIKHISELNMCELYELVAECRYCPVYGKCDNEDCDVWIKWWINERV